MENVLLCTLLSPYWVASFSSAWCLWLIPSYWVLNSHTILNWEVFPESFPSIRWHPPATPSPALTSPSPHPNTHSNSTDTSPLIFIFWITHLGYIAYGCYDQFLFYILYFTYILLCSPTTPTIFQFLLAPDCCILNPKYTSHLHWCHPTFPQPSLPKSFPSILLFFY